MDDKWPETVFVTMPSDRKPMEAYLGLGSWPGERVEYVRADLAEALADALRTVCQHGRIDDSESRMNQCGAALSAWEKRNP